MMNGADKRSEGGTSVDITNIDTISKGDLRSIKAKLTARQQLFCEKYIELGFKSGGQAAIEAGYSGTNAYVSASTMLRNPNVKKYIQVRKKQMLHDIGINTYSMLHELARIAFADVRQLYNESGGLKNINELSADAAASIEAIETFDITNPMTGEIIGTTKRVKFNNKLKALEMLMKFRGMLDKDNQQKQPMFNEYLVSLNLGGAVPQQQQLPEAK